ncbi:MAG TPA: tetratricopeptide repeat protein, partial [Chitinophagales bacterium]|nr:tetratricopeptide repeat protein [Chitinophagales bacterium]
MTKKKALKETGGVDVKSPRRPVAVQKLATPWLWLAVLAVVTFVVFIPALQNGFVNLDDDRYVEKNPKLFLESKAASFKIPEGYHMGNYHPFTMVGYKIIYGAAQLDPYVYHLVNVILHVLNTLLAFFFIQRLTKQNTIAFAAALLFGVHAIHVESVAWISELKDLLYAFFFFAALIFYVRYIDERNKSFYAFALVLFVCSLFSKAMAASLAVVLPLIDFYRGRKFTMAVILEKVPFFVLALIFGVIAIRAQQSMEAIQDSTLYAPVERIAFASYGFVTYLWKLVLPINLSAYYAYPVKNGGSIPTYYYLYPLAVIGILVATIMSLKKTKVVFFGVGFFAITVFLVLQLLPVGGAIMADRYAYIPSLGIFFLFAVGLQRLYENQSQRALAYGALGVLTVLYGVLTWERCKVWKDGMTLWSDVIDKAQTIVLAYNNRGVLYNEEGSAILARAKTDPTAQQRANAQFNLALNDFDNALRLNNKDAQAWSNRGLSFWRMNRLDSAANNMQRAINIDPNYEVAWSNLGSIYASMGRNDDALTAFKKAVELNPGFADGWY